jgi:hypothetical protein
LSDVLSFVDPNVVLGEGAFGIVRFFFFFFFSFLFSFVLSLGCLWMCLLLANDCSVAFGICFNQALSCPSLFLVFFFFFFSSSSSSPFQVYRGKCRGLNVAVKMPKAFDLTDEQLAEFKVRES